MARAAPLGCTGAGSRGGTGAAVTAAGTAIRLDAHRGGSSQHGQAQSRSPRKQSPRRPGRERRQPRRPHDPRRQHGGAGDPARAEDAQQEPRRQRRPPRLIAHVPCQLQEIPVLDARRADRFAGAAAQAAPNVPLERVRPGIQTSFHDRAHEVASGPGGESASSPSRRYVGQAGRQKPQCTQLRQALFLLLDGQCQGLGCASPPGQCPPAGSARSQPSRTSGGQHAMRVGTGP